mgnify:CR=1 FL=1
MKQKQFSNISHLPKLKGKLMPCNHKQGYCSSKCEVDKVEKEKDAK